MAPLALTTTYRDSRGDFLERARAAGAAVTTLDHPDAGPEGEKLAVDAAWIGPADATSVVVVVSGTHGVEGYAGSALQRTWLRDLSPEPPADVAVCLVHALNPHGFARGRQVDEDDVDVNRNFVDFADPPDNPGYDRIAGLLVPETWDEATQEWTSTRLLEIAGAVGAEAFQEWVAAGQYRHRTGLFYGGERPTWSHRALRSLCEGLLAGRQRVCFIDVHTGLGPWGVGEVMSNDGPDDAAYRRAVDWFGDDVTSVVAGDSVSSRLSGVWLPAAGRLLEPAEVTGVALEFGTADGATVLHAQRADAWLHAHGDPGGDEARPIKAELRRVFADDDPAWIADLHTRFRGVLDGALRGLGRRPTPAASR